MMEFDEIVVKESPGLCRCCLSEGCYKDMGTEYTWMNENEVYADMLLECFDIGISQHNEGPNGPNRLICEVCITRLRDACNFKKQVLDSEKKFIDMIGRGEFRPKVLIYQAQMKAETEDMATNEVEYLDDDIDFGDADDDLPLKQPDEPSVSEDITVSTLPVKNKRGRPRKTVVKTEKKSKLAKAEARTSKAIVKGIRIKKESQSFTERLCSMRTNILTVLRYGNVFPFNWNTKGFRCFYCSKPMTDCIVLKEHTIQKHSNVDLDVFIPKRIISKDVPVKMDVTDISCNLCSDMPVGNLEELITHIIVVHEEMYDNSAGVCIFPFVLKKDEFQCAVCGVQFDNFTCLVGHMNKDHIEHSYVCQICGLSFIDNIRLKRHINCSHVGHRCTICKKIFSAAHKLEKHRVRIHGQVRTYNCNLCSESFENNYQVKVHMGKVHNVEKYRIKCEYCPKVCTTKGAMLLHVQSMHSEAKYDCDLCDYKTAIKWMLKLHKRKHFGEKNYSCSICARKFGRSSNLRAHMKVHTGQPGRVCRDCRHGFIDTESLSAHQREMHYFDQL